jgi:hypothetical protein
MNAHPDEVFLQQGKLSREEITDRFKRVFGREMTPAERRSFFLDLPFSKEKETTDL